MEIRNLGAFKPSHFMKKSTKEEKKEYVMYIYLRNSVIKIAEKKKI